MRIGNFGNVALAAQAADYTAARAALLDRLSLIAAGGAGELTAARAALLERLGIFAGGGNQELTIARVTGLDNVGARKTAGVGTSFLPTTIGGGQAATSGVANTYGAWAQVTASTAEADYIVGILWLMSNADGGYVQVQIGTGAGGSESVIATTRWVYTTFAGALPPIMFSDPVPVATATRIAIRVAGGTGSIANAFALLIMRQVDRVVSGAN